MIADAVYLAIAGIGFCHAASRSIFSSTLKVGVATLVPQAWIRGRRRFQRNCSASTTELPLVNASTRSGRHEAPTARHSLVAS